MEGFTKAQIAELTELAPRQVQFFTEEGIVTPAIDKGKGRGRRRRYSRKNLFEFLLVAEFVAWGMTITRIAVSLKLVAEGLLYVYKHSTQLDHTREAIASQVAKDPMEFFATIIPHGPTRDDEMLVRLGRPFLLPGMFSVWVGLKSWAPTFGKKGELSAMVVNLSAVAEKAMSA